MGSVVIVRRLLCLVIQTSAVEHARCCLKHAAAASTSIVRDNFLSVAQSWTRLARELEASERLLAALEEVPRETTSDLRVTRP